MKTKTNNQIREEVRKQLAATHKAALEAIKKDRTLMREKYIAETEKVAELTKENNELKQKVAALEEWNQRLLEFMDLPDNERKEAYARYITDNELNETLSTFFTKYAKLFQF